MPGAARRALPLRIDKRAPTPAYLQLRRLLADAVAAGRLRAGTALPSEREMASRVGLSRMTVRRAVEALVREGVLERRHGSGTYVREPPLEQTFDRVLGFTDEARGLGTRPGTTLLDAREAPAGERAARALGVPEGTPLLVVTRLRTADGRPLAIQSAHLAPPLAGLSVPRLRRGESLYGTLRAQYGVVPHRARQTVTARLPRGDERRRLGLGAHEPVLDLERTTMTADGVAFEYVRSAYRGDRYRLALELGPAGAEPRGAAEAPAPEPKEAP